MEMALSSQKLIIIKFSYKGQFKIHICQLNVSCGQDYIRVRNSTL
jgi:hypothetical protein